MKKIASIIMPFILLSALAVTLTKFVDVKLLLDAAFSKPSEYALMFILWLVLTCMFVMWRAASTNNLQLVERISSLVFILAFLAIAFGTVVGTWSSSILMSSGHKFLSKEHAILRALLFLFLSLAPIILAKISTGFPAQVKKIYQEPYGPLRLYLASAIGCVGWIYITTLLVSGFSV